MGNSSSKSNKKLKWSSNNTKVINVHTHHANVKAVCCYKLNTAPNSIIIASASEGGSLIISKLNIKLKDKNGANIIKETKCNKIIGIPLIHGWSMAVDLSPSMNYISSGGLDNKCSIFQINVHTGHGWITNALYKEFEHQGYISGIKFIDDNFILTSSGDGTIKLWDIQNNHLIKTINDDVQSASAQNDHDINCIDYIYLDHRHIVIYACNDSKYQIFIDDITDALDKYKNNDNGNGVDVKTNNDDYLTKMDDNNVIYMCYSQRLGNIKQSEDNVNSIKFSGDGKYIGACLDNGSYNIYYRFDHYDHWWNVKIIQWQFLCCKQFHKLLIHKYNNININDTFVKGLSVTWCDNKTVMISTDHAQHSIFVTKLIEQKTNETLINAINNGVFEIISNLPSMKWIGLAKEVSKVILLYFSDFDIIDYIIKPKTNKYSKSVTQKEICCLNSCKWGDNDQYNIVIMGRSYKDVDAIISAQQ